MGKKYGDRTDPSKMKEFDRLSSHKFHKILGLSVVAMHQRHFRLLRGQPISIRTQAGPALTKNFPFSSPPYFLPGNLL
jgi:hypothetical protein